MRLIGILIALLIVGLLTYKEMDSDSIQKPPEATIVASSSTPKTPSTAEDVKQFETQMNDYIKSAAEKQASVLEDAASQ